MRLKFVKDEHGIVGDYQIRTPDGKIRGSISLEDPNGPEPWDVIRFGSGMGATSYKSLAAAKRGAYHLFGLPVPGSPEEPRCFCGCGKAARWPKKDPRFCSKACALGYAYAMTEGSTWAPNAVGYTDDGEAIYSPSDYDWQELSDAERRDVARAAGRTESDM